MASTNYNHVLYHSTFSVCSVMVRMSYAWRGEVKDTKNEIVIKEEHVEIGKKEQLSELFLCDVNHYGEVPTLVPVGAKPIPDSLDITLYLAEFYPALIPEKHSTEIKCLLRRLHEINYFSITFPGKPESPLDSIQTLQERLRENISPRYRDAIQIKMKRIEGEKLAAVSEEEVERNIQCTTAVLDELQSILTKSSTEWCFGLSQPSALDAHLLVFITRLQDVMQDHLVPSSLKTWADNAMQRAEWKNLMQGRRTLPPPLIASIRAERA